MDTTGAALDLAHQLTRHSVAARITATQALEHPFLLSNRETLASGAELSKRKSEGQLVQIPSQ